MLSAILVAENISKSYPGVRGVVHALAPLSFSLQPGDTCAVVGPSGSGKTTLLSLLAGLDRPSSGHVELCGRNLQSLSQDECAALRNQLVGFVFQNFQLIPTLTALENVMVPLEIRGASGARGKAGELLDQVGLNERIQHYPVQLSGGEQQRVAIARAFINDPQLLFADEPTGNLDTETSAVIEELLFTLNRQRQTTLVLVTHDKTLAARTDERIDLTSASPSLKSSADHGSLP